MINTNDTGPGSLRQAITTANAATGPADDHFNIPKTDPGFNAGTGAWTISPASAAAADHQRGDDRRLLAARRGGQHAGRRATTRSSRSS